MKEKLWRFTDNFGTFESRAADKIKSLYFPLANEALMSAISPDLHGDIKTGNNSFLLQPVSRIDLSELKSSRNFWIYIDKNKIWSATGVSKDLAQIKQDKFNLEAGLLWQKIERENRKIGLKSEILLFAPATGEPVEIMQVKITNVSACKIKFTPTAAIPMYARGANNIRDHRHVTSLLQRIIPDKYGVIAKPTLSFDEAGHKPNKNYYFVLGCDEKSRAPQYIYPTQEIFCGDAGDLEAPEAVMKNSPPDKNAPIQGREPMGGLRFDSVTLAPKQSKTYIAVMGITEKKEEIRKAFNRFNTTEKVRKALQKTKESWIARSQQASISTGDVDFDNWFRWVSIQPTLRKIFGCSFLPDFDYGKGGRGWRDLWQDCLSLILNEPGQVRNLLINNFSGVRIDGSNATIIGKKPGEFIADRNDIARVWMDHGVWPLLTLDLYLHETGDFNILFEKTAYFRDQHIFRSRELDRSRKKSDPNILKTADNKVYKGTILEHLLVENLVQFFNVAAHNHVRLEGGDWNDGLDMAGENGESVAFSAMYAHNLSLLAWLLEKIERPEIEVAEELKLLLGPVNYDSVKAKQKLLENYFIKTSRSVSGKKIRLDIALLADNLMTKSEWMADHIRKNEWLGQGFFNGYYDNNKQRVEGRKDNLLRMSLSSQVFPIMSGVASDWQVEKILKSVNKYLLDKKLKGYHLNTDFGAEQHNLGRAFSFVYGEKENGAFFNHMVMMFANALYRRGRTKEGWQALSSIYRMALDTPKSKIYPCLPEYFNLEGRGMYSYLTGSASWFVLTLVRLAFGIRGKDGDLLIEPKLSAEQFKDSSTININRTFSGRNLKINFFNPRKLPYGKYKIAQGSLNSQNLSIEDPHRVVIPRKTILKLSKNKLNTINIVLG
jgi:cellobiose phosphorylase